MAGCILQYGPSVNRPRGGSVTALETTARAHAALEQTWQTSAAAPPSCVVVVLTHRPSLHRRPIVRRNVGHFVADHWC